MPEDNPTPANNAAPAVEGAAPKEPSPLRLKVVAFLKRFSLLLLGFVLMLASFALETHRIHEGESQPPFATDGPLLAALGRGLSFVWSAMPYFLEHLGVVLIVAVLVRELIEKAREAEFIGAVNENLGKTLDKLTHVAFEPIKAQISTLQANLGITIQRDGVLDQKSLDELTDKVLNPKFMRTTYTLDLTIEPYPALTTSPELPRGHVLVTCKTSYTVLNLTESAKPYEINGWMEVMEDAWLPPGFEKTRFTRLAFGPIEKKEEDIKRGFPTEGIQAVAEEALRLKYELQEMIPAKKSFFVELEGKQVLRTQDLFIWSMSALTNELIVNVTLTGGLNPQNFNVSAREMHHHPGMETPTTSASFTWKIKDILLPHQGVQIWWSPKPTPESAKGQ